jgi:hypothetical protein
VEISRQSGHYALVPGRNIRWLVALVLASALLANCSDKPRYYTGTITSISARDRACISVIGASPISTVCGTLPASLKGIRKGECIRTQWRANEKGTFSEGSFSHTTKGCPLIPD